VKNNNLFLQIIFVMMILAPGIILSQVSEKRIEKTGKITFQSSQNIYVRFDNTDGINEGDTLYIKKNKKLVPAIIVKYLSASSCSGKSIGNTSINDGETIIAFVEERLENKAHETGIKPVMIDTLALQAQNKVVDTVAVPEIKSNYIRNYKPDKTYNGRFSIQSISSLDNTSAANDLQRWRYTFSFNKSDFMNSHLSFSNYIVFAYTANQWSDVKSNINNSLKVYDLTLTYKPNEQTTFWLGRHLNSKVGNIGATDGLQIERQMGDFYSGLIVGSRPNYMDYSYNLKLFEYGGYIGLFNRSNDIYIENVIGAFQQTNDMKVDRRFLYFQHSDNLIPKTNLFMSSEIDLYKRDSNNIGQSTFNLTSFYLTLRVAPSRVFSFTTTYDARRNVVYYETYKFIIDTLFQNQLRQGLRFNTYIRPVNNLFVGLNAGYQFRSGDVQPSKNYGGYLNYINFPFFDINPSLNFVKIISNYLNGTDAGGKLSKYFSNGMSISIGYRKLIYQFTTVPDKINQNIFSSDLSFILFGSLSLSINYEGVFESSNTFSRVFIDLTTRF
jgi:hypothetical protein